MGLIEVHTNGELRVSALLIPRYFGIVRATMLSMLKYANGRCDYYEASGRCDPINEIYMQLII